MTANESQVQLPGPVVLFGSGETSPSGRKAFEHILRQMPLAPRMALLETPAGFELNSTQVIRRVADFIEHRLQNYRPQTFIVPARRRGTACSPDRLEIAQALLEADLIFMGPGSPTYAVRQLRDSLAWYYLIARHRLGAVLALASAAAIAISAQALPVYEIYKAGEDLHWVPGLDLFGPFGLQLVVIPHWNNTDGGEELDTSRCFMGKARFGELLALLPAGQTVLGIDENTALVLDLNAGRGQVIGQGSVTLLKPALARDSLAAGSPAPAQQRIASGQEFMLSECCPLHPPEPGAGIPPEIWEDSLRVAQPGRQPSQPPENVQAMAEARERLRQEKDWAAADRLRKEILELGWEVSDTPEGPSLSRSEDRKA